MKKWVVLFLAIGFWGCNQDDEFDKIAAIENEIEFNLSVPNDFSWSAVTQDVLLVSITSGSEKTLALDGSVMELFNEDDELLDAMTIAKGTVCFNVRIPTVTKKLKLRTPATNTLLEFSALKRSLRFEIPGNFKSSKKTDTDGDGLTDEFDYAPKNPEVTLRINKNYTNKTSSYFIFEDLWPSKGDFDFNDFIVKTNVSWKRGKGNYITEISGICELQRNSSEYGLGFELFEAKGTYLIYMEDVIVDLEGAKKTELISNGFVVFDDFQEDRKITRNFTIQLKENTLTDFTLVPYLFKQANKQHQIRSFGTPPTQLQKMQMFHSMDDASPNNWQWVKGAKFKYPLAGDEAFYRTAEGHPWGVQFMAQSFIPSGEMQSILISYPQFQSWAESGGTENKDWYNHPSVK